VEREAILEFVVEKTKVFDSSIERLSREVGLLNEYRTRLVADVVTGKLDVREAATRLPDEAPLDPTEGGVEPDDEAEAADEEVVA
jgi:type I restriction enzyme S subunit